MTATLITGGTGLIGAAIAGRLLACGAEVVLVDVLPSAQRVATLTEQFPQGRLTVAGGDVATLAPLMELVQRHDVSSIVHLASMLGPDSDANPAGAARVNIEGTTNVLDAARLAGLRRVVLASSIAVYGSDSSYDANQLPLTENAPQWGAPGMRMYAAAKIYMELLAQHYATRFGLSVVSLRPSIVHGPGRRTGATSVVTRIIEDGLSGDPVTVGLGDARMSLIYLEEVADQLVALLDAPESSFTDDRSFNSGGFTCTVRELAQLVQRLRPGTQINVMPSAERDVGGLVSSVSGQLLRDRIGYRPRFQSLEEAVLHQMGTVRSVTDLPRVSATST